MKARRIGSFKVAPKFLELDNITARRLMAKVVVLHADYSFAGDIHEFIALCEDFDECHPAQIVPEYEVICGGDPVQVSFRRLS